MNSGSIDDLVSDLGVIFGISGADGKRRIPRYLTSESTDQEHQHFPSEGVGKDQRFLAYILASVVGTSFSPTLFGQRPRREPEGTKSCRIQGESVQGVPSQLTFKKTIYLSNLKSQKN